jgi:hypothetical protein
MKGRTSLPFIVHYAHGLKSLKLMGSKDCKMVGSMVGMVLGTVLGMDVGNMPVEDMVVGMDCKVVGSMLEHMDHSNDLNCS